MWANLAVFAVSAVLYLLLAPKPETPKAAKLDEFSAPTAKEGDPIPVVFGTVWVRKPNVCWYGDLAPRPIKKSLLKK